MNEIKVVAPTREVFELFLQREYAAGHDLNWYQFVTDYTDITCSWHAIIILNGGSHDAHIRNICNHPSRQGIITRMEV